MNYPVTIVDQANGKALPGWKLGLVPYNPDGYSLEDTGWWTTSQADGFASIYYSGDITGWVLNIWSPESNSVTTLRPATDYTGRRLAIDTVKKPFPWWLVLVGAGLWYLVNEKKPLRRKAKPR